MYREIHIYNRAHAKHIESIANAHLRYLCFSMNAVILHNQKSEAKS